MIYFKMDCGVVTLLTDRAQDEEFKEALLAYAFLPSPPNRQGIPDEVSLMPDKTMTLQNLSSSESKLDWQRTMVLMTYLLTSKTLWMF